MPIYEDEKERYWTKICCETMALEKPKEEDLYNANIARSFTESAWAVFDKAGEFLFEQHEDGTIDYPATAVSFAVMAIQMYYSGGLGTILSMANKNPSKLE